MQLQQFKANYARLQKWWQGVLGMNRRNHYIDRQNPPRSVYLVNNKMRTKDTLRTSGVAHVPTLAHICNRMELARFAWQALPDRWVLKPNLGSQGVGILLADERSANGWRTTRNQVLDVPMLVEHAQRILEGEWSMAGVVQDSVLFEPLVTPAPVLAALVPAGLPDIRVICVRAEPVLAMSRLPTAASAGRANLHQGAVGTGIDLARGRITRARWQGHFIDRHPDTGAPLVGTEIPRWQSVLEMAARCGSAFELGYMGVDIVIDAEHGPLVMEVNARPGLEIQNIAGIGLQKLLQHVPSVHGHE